MDRQFDEPVSRQFLAQSQPPSAGKWKGLQSQVSTQYRAEHLTCRNRAGVLNCQSGRQVEPLLTMRAGARVR